MREPKEGELYRLKDGDGWCRHGIVYIRLDGNGQLIAEDTYWGGFYSGGARYPLTPELKKRLTFMLDLRSARSTHAEEWEVFADEDRAYIPIGGGSAQHWVRKDARPSYSRRVARLERLIREEREKARLASSLADGYEKELQAFKDAKVHRLPDMGACAPECAICAAALAR